MFLLGVCLRRRLEPISQRAEKVAKGVSLSLCDFLLRLSPQRRAPVSRKLSLVYTGYLPGISRVYPGYIPGICWVYSTRQVCPGSIPGGREPFREPVSARVVLAVRSHGTLVGHQGVRKRP